VRWERWERVCKRCGAPTWSPKSPYCLTHRPSLELRVRWAAKRRDNRDYGANHQAVRERCKELVASGLDICARCGQPIAKGAQFDLDHADDRAGYLGVSHSRCNRQAGARRCRGHERGTSRDPRFAGVVNSATSERVRLGGVPRLASWRFVRRH
jgi:hypothetical protein